MSCLLQAGIASGEEGAQDSTPDPLGGSTRFGVYEIDVTQMEVSASLAVERWALRIAPPTRRSSAKSLKDH
jgi:hypothetical protein